MDYTQTRGWRNNNPLNIKHSDADWQGLADEQTDPVFCKFITMSYGYRASIKTLQSYYNHFKRVGKPNSIENIVSRWCPSGIEAYLKVVEKASGLSRHKVLSEPRNITAYNDYVKLMGAMTVMECGCPQRDIPWRAIQGGYWLAYHIK